MRIWTVVVGEPSPVDGPATRLLRTGILAHTLSTRGHDVTWFNATFNHNLKIQRFSKSTIQKNVGGLTLAFMHGRAYRSNVSIARIENHMQVARSFKKMAERMEKPDVIQCSYPPIELAHAVAQFAKKNGIPYIIDYRDLWPDIIADVAPVPLRPLAKLAMTPWYKQAREATLGAAGLCAITKPYLEWASKFAGRKPDARDRVFHLATAGSKAPDADIKKAEAFWDAQGITGKIPTLVFSGTLSRRMDLYTLLDAAEILPEEVRQKIRIVICGKGEAEEELKKKADGLPHVLMAGWRNQAELQALMGRAKAGLLPYISTIDFQWSYPNKVGEYLGAGLPIITSVTGIVEALIKSEGCGACYREGDKNSCAQLLTMIAENRIDLAPMSYAARKVYARDFDARKIYDDYAGYIESFRQL
ncbi:MAG: glycosyltransferase WbuB [Proteobacteria bacterium]|nr:glycosyltransferase WbuB [Pseudomonadota bacterium]